MPVPWMNKTEELSAWTIIILYELLKHIVDENNKRLKLQAAMEGTSPGSPPTGGFRKTGNSEQYAFKKVNIEEYVKVIYMCQTCWWRHVHN